MKITIIFLLLSMIINHIICGSFVGGAAHGACCALVYASKAFLEALYLSMVGKYIATCVEGVIPGPPHIPTIPRDTACLVAETIIHFVPSV